MFKTDPKKAKKKIDDKVKSGKSLTIKDRDMCDMIKKAGLR